MSTNDKTEWLAFQVDLLKSKFQGEPSEAELIDRLNAMMKRRNVFAIRAATQAKMVSDPGGKIVPNNLWAKGAVYNLIGYDEPG